MKKKNYIRPELEICVFETEDVITVSPPISDPNNGLPVK